MQICQAPPDVVMLPGPSWSRALPGWTHYRGPQGGGVDGVFPWVRHGFRGTVPWPGLPSYFKGARVN